ncbi:MAG TPA: hypothetical protein PLS21_01425 [Synergistales bacterium]|nr:hypothetical protein [Synergistaceae bacterium]HPA58391.1 hypothetical protein [Synergistales bacterium]HQO82636.1 hypothetical protein [Synergistales bacterium]HQQ11084.1 hypothetical protein [Synergistales bacterium]
MTQREKTWVLFSILYGAFNVIVPFTVLRDVGTLAGAFLFWNLITAAVLLAGAWITSGWKDRGGKEILR